MPPEPPPDAPGLVLAAGLDPEPDAPPGAPEPEPVDVWASAVLPINAAASPRATILIGVFLFTDSTVGEERKRTSQVPARRLC
jgi:hypothetical protein